MIFGAGLLRVSLFSDMAREGIFLNRFWEINGIGIFDLAGGSAFQIQSQLLNFFTILMKNLYSAVESAQPSELDKNVRSMLYIYILVSRASIVHTTKSTFSTLRSAKNILIIPSLAGSNKTPSRTISRKRTIGLRK